MEWEAERRDALAWLEMNSHDKGKEGSSAKNYNLCFLKIRIIRFCNLSSSLLPIWYLSHLVSMFPILPSSVNLHMTLDYSRGPAQILRIGIRMLSRVPSDLPDCFPFLPLSVCRHTAARHHASSFFPLPPSSFTLQPQIICSSRSGSPCRKPNWPMNEEILREEPALVLMLLRLISWTNVPHV